MGKVSEHFVEVLGREELDRRMRLSSLPQQKFDEAMGELTGPKSVGVDLVYQFKKEIEKQMDKLECLDDLTENAKRMEDFDKHEKALAKLDDLVGEMTSCLESAYMAVVDAKETWADNQPTEEFQGFNKPKDFL